jgi:TorA maturation chaperone TorD
MSLVGAGQVPLARGVVKGSEMSGFVDRERAKNEIVPYAVTDKRQLQFMLGSPDFTQAFTMGMRLLAACFVYRPVEGGSLGALSAIRGMDVMDDWPFGTKDALMPVGMQLAMGQMDDPRELDWEFQRLFRGTGTRVAPPFGSVYMDHDQVINGWTWMALRDWMRQHDITALYEENEPEDQFGRMLSLAAELDSARPDLLAEFLGDHLLPWSGHFLELFLTDNLPATYRGLAMLAQVTLDDVQETLGIVPAKRRFFR